MCAAGCSESKNQSTAEAVVHPLSVHTLTHICILGTDMPNAQQQSHRRATREGIFLLLSSPDSPLLLPLSFAPLLSVVFFFDTAAATSCLHGCMNRRGRRLLFSIPQPPSFFHGPSSVQQTIRLQGFYSFLFFQKIGGTHSAASASQQSNFCHVAKTLTSTTRLLSFVGIGLRSPH